jgi:AraC-like DNA-binding protein
MLTYSLAANAARRTKFNPPVAPQLNGSLPRQGAMLLRRFEGGDPRSNRWGTLRPSDGKFGTAGRDALDITPAHVVCRRAVGWDGVRAELIQSLTHDRVEFRFRAPWHLLLVYEEGVRDAGDTLVGQFLRSTLRTLRRKLTFVPAGQEYHEWQEPSVRSRIICFYFDPVRMPIRSDLGQAAAVLAPRLFFENNAIWELAVKLAAAIEDGCEADRYSEALSIVVAHELLRLHGHVRRPSPPARGGLAAWQQRMIAAYIEEHLAEPIPLAVLAKLVNLSSYHFCRAFKQSFGVPPHRYHIHRRIEFAKRLLVNPARPVTEIALAVGFSETSSFSAAFRQTAGTAPTEYRRNLA